MNNKILPPPPPIKCTKRSGKIYFTNSNCNLNNKENTNYKLDDKEYILYQIKKLLQDMISFIKNRRINVENITKEIEQLEYNNLEEVLNKILDIYKNIYSEKELETFKKTEYYKYIENSIKEYKLNNIKKILKFIIFDIIKVQGSQNINNQHIIEEIKQLEYDNLEGVFNNLLDTYKIIYGEKELKILKNTGDYKYIKNTIKKYKNNQPNRLNQNISNLPVIKNSKKTKQNLTIEYTNLSNTFKDTLCFSWNPDGTKVAIANANNFISILNIGQKNSIITIPNAHNSKINEISWSPNGLYIASVSDDKYLRILDANNNTLIASICCAQSKLLHIAWKFDSEYLIYTSENNTLRLISIELMVNAINKSKTKQESVSKNSFETILAPTSKNNKNIVITSIRWFPYVNLDIFIIGANNGCYLYSIYTINKKKILDIRRINRSEIKSIAIINDNKNNKFAYSYDNIIVICNFYFTENHDLSDKPKLYEINKKILSDNEKDTKINSISFSPDGKYIVSASNKMQIWDINLGICIYTFDIYDDPNLNYVIWNPSEKYILLKSSNKFVLFYFNIILKNIMINFINNLKQQHNINAILLIYKLITKILVNYESINKIGKIELKTASEIISKNNTNININNYISKIKKYINNAYDLISKNNLTEESKLNYENLFKIIKWFALYSTEISEKEIYDYLKEKIRRNAKTSLLSLITSIFSRK